MSESIIYRTVEEIPSLLWDDLLAHSTYAGYFQTRACYDVYERTKGLTAFVYAISQDGELQALVCGYIAAEGNRLKRFFSRRAIVPGGLLIRDGSGTNAVEELLEVIKQELQRKAIYIEMRNFEDYNLHKNVFIESGFSYVPHLDIRLAIGSKTEVYNGLSSTKKRQIRQSEKKGVVWKVADTEDELVAFYRILCDLYIQKIKLPLFDISFFRQFLDSNAGKLLVVIYHNKVVGGILCASYNRKVLYEWFVCGEELKSESVYPSVMSTWAALEYATDNGYAYFDFMGAGRPDVDYGVRDFKLKFGGHLVEYGRFIWVINAVLYRIGVLYLRLSNYLYFKS